MNLIFTCGGTAGHINPAIAVANMMKQRHPDAKILFIGAVGKMEEKLVPQAGFELKSLPASGLSRKLNFGGIKQNVHAVKCVFNAVSECKKIFKEFKPDAVIGTGGYASFPALYAAQSMGIPTCVHEANAVPGVTTKMAAKKADRVLVAFEESVQYYAKPEKVQVVVSAFGSLGAKVMNETMAEMFAMEQKDGYPFHHIHATGSFGWEWMPEKVRPNGVDWENCESIDMREYIYNMPTVMAAADVIISRAGASTCNEIGASGTPCILIPSPNVTNNHQEKNARVLADRGGAVMILEKDCTAEKMYEQIKTLLASEDSRRQMSDALRGMVQLDSAEQICDMLEELAK